jgi:hypothetical protein
LGPELTPLTASDAQWRSWYLIIKANFSYLDDGFRRSAILMDAAHTSSWALLIARLILPGHRYLLVLIGLTIVCFGIAAFNKIFLALSSFGYFASDLTGATLGAAMLKEIRKEKLGAKETPPTP